jgi:site-specific recombinase XerC
VFSKITGFLSMKMGMRHCIQCSQSTAVQAILDMLEEKGLKQKTLGLYLCRRWFSWKEREAYSSIERMKKAYCALSPRADEELFIEFCEDFDYAPII